LTLNALVTGGSSGLGASLVAGLLAGGYHVVSLDRHPPEVTHEHLTFQSTELGDTARLVSTVETLAGTVFDVVVFSAGISAVGAFERIPPEQLQRVFDINLLAPIELTRLLLIRGALAPSASLVFIASLSNRLGYPGASVYAATKSGLEAFARSLRPALTQTVLCVLPGPLDTDHARRYAPRGGRQRQRMPPEALTTRILSNLRRSGTLYANLPQQLAGWLGHLLPAAATDLMRRGLFARLKASTPVVDDEAR
jgi:cyclic-di-GMP-binding biofilm dispersal mediator protein